MGNATSIESPSPGKRKAILDSRTDITLEQYNRFVPNSTRQAVMELLEVEDKMKRSEVPKIYLSEFNKLKSKMVVPTGLFPVKTVISMPNNFKGLDRRPLRS